MWSTHSRYLGREWNLLRLRGIQMMSSCVQCNSIALTWDLTILSPFFRSNGRALKNVSEYIKNLKKFSLNCLRGDIPTIYESLVHFCGSNADLREVSVTFRNETIQFYYVVRFAQDFIVKLSTHRMINSIHLSFSADFKPGRRNVIDAIYDGIQVLGLKKVSDNIVSLNTKLFESTRE